MGFNTAQNLNTHFSQKEASLIKRIQNENLHTTEQLLNVLPTNRQFLNKVLQK
jgi:hypothetical protein